MFTEEEMKAFYEGKRTGYEGHEYNNPHLEFISGIAGSEVALKEDKLYRQFKRGFEWGKAQKDEEQK